MRNLLTADAVATLSKLVSNRAEFFDLLNQLEAEICREIDERILEAEIDSDFSGRSALDNVEAAFLLTTVEAIEFEGYEEPTLH